MIAPCAGAQSTRMLIVSGVSGDPRYATAFTSYGTSLLSAARTRFGIPDSMVHWFAEDTVGPRSLARARSTKANIERELGAMMQKSAPGDRVIVVLFGHGSEQGLPRINLPGPDMTDADFARVLGQPGEVTIAFVNTASASGEFARTLAGRNRIVVTATKSSREANETLFPRHFVRAIAEGAGDGDKDGRISILEAFTYARKEVEKIFEGDNRIATEHPQLEDDGDGVATATAGEKPTGDGVISRGFFFEPAGGAALASDPRAARLLAERRAIEARLDSLRARRSTMSEDDYQKALEPLMIDLAAKTQALRALEVRKP
ncbi:MAG: hypothetical protein ACT4OZ_00015 [Gemmatimonadota bacterium]